MKIEKAKYCFRDIAVGESFLYGDRVYIACEEHYSKYRPNDEYEMVNAVCLNNGSLNHFCEDLTVDCLPVIIKVGC